MLGVHTFLFRRLLELCGTICLLGIGSDPYEKEILIKWPKSFLSKELARIVKEFKQKKRNQVGIAKNAKNGNQIHPDTSNRIEPSVVKTPMPAFSPQPLLLPPIEARPRQHDPAQSLVNVPA